MVSFTLAAIGALAATTVTAVPVEARASKAFEVTTVVPLNQSSFTGQQLSLYHVGAAEFDIVITKNKSLANTFKIGGASGSELYYTQGQQVPGGETAYYYVDLTSYVPNFEGKPAAPSGYSLVQANLGSSGTTGFALKSVSATNPKNKGGLSFTGSAANGFADFGAFAVCHVKKAINGNTGNVFLWRKSSTPADTTGQCFDVSLYTTAGSA